MKYLYIFFLPDPAGIWKLLMSEQYSFHGDMFICNNNPIFS